MAYNYNKKCLINIPLEPLLIDFFYTFTKNYAGKRILTAKMSICIVHVEKANEKMIPTTLSFPEMLQ